MAPESSVVDASAVVDLLTDHSDEIRVLRERLVVKPQSVLISAPHMKGECLSAIRRMVIDGRLDENRALATVKFLCRLDINYELPDEVVLDAWSLRDSFSAYDACYVALAEKYKLRLITTDKKLIRACSNRATEAVHLKDLKI